MVKVKIIKNGYAKNKSCKQIKSETVDQFIDKVKLILIKYLKIKSGRIVTSWKQLIQKRLDGVNSIKEHLTKYK